ncbi:MAG: TetR/AcrR family transcriptional regulator [Pseudomonadota bacterium]
MPKIVDKEEMQDKIRAHAMRAFIQEGYHATTIDTVAKQAGIAKGTVYLYFESKEQLALSIADAHFAQLEETLTSEDLVDTKANFLKHLEDALDVEDDQADFIPVFFEIFGPSFREEEFTKNLSASYDKIARFYSRQLLHLQKKKQIGKDVNAKQMAGALVSMIDGLIMHRGVLSLTKRKFRPRIKEIVQLIDKGLK